MTAQVCTVFYPHAVSTVYLNDDASVGIHFYIYQEVVTLLQPFLYCCLNCLLINHKCVN